MARASGKATTVVGPPEAKMSPAVERKTRVRARTRTNDPDATQANILDVATSEFATHGFDGARIDTIAEKTKTSKRMIYYYFGHKKGLYQAVLTNYYVRLRQAERNIDLENLSALEAIEKLTHSTFDYHMRNADIVRLVMVENIAKGQHIDELPSLDPISSVLINTLKKICQRGFKEGVMRKVDPTRLYMSIAALCFFNVSNRYTFQKIFNVDMTSQRAADQRKKEVADMILRYIRP